MPTPQPCLPAAWNVAFQSILCTRSAFSLLSHMEAELKVSSPLRQRAREAPLCAGLCHAVQALCAVLYSWRTSFGTHEEVGTIIMPILQMRKLRQRIDWQLVQGHTSSK